MLKLFFLLYLLVFDLYLLALVVVTIEPNSSLLISKLKSEHLHYSTTTSLQVQLQILLNEINLYHILQTCIATVRNEPLLK